MEFQDLLDVEKGDFDKSFMIQKMLELSEELKSNYSDIIPNKNQNSPEEYPIQEYDDETTSNDLFYGE
jgi:hypothetical protein